MSEPDEAQFCLNKAMSGAVDDPLIMSQTLEQMATVELVYGSPVLSVRFYEGAYDAAKKLDEDRVFQIRQNMAAVYRQRGNMSRREPRGEPGYQSTVRSARSRDLNDLAGPTNTRRPLRAEAGYREALNPIEALATSDSTSRR